MHTGLKFRLFLALVTASFPLLPTEFSDAQEPPEWRGPVLVQPVNGSIVASQLTVRIGFAGRNPRGPDEGTGLGPEHAPGGGLHPDYHPESNQPHEGGGPSEGTGLSGGGERRPPRGPHFALLIDAPTPEPGSSFIPDGQHVTFPVGIPQMTVTLPPGNHQLTLLVLDRAGGVSKRFHAAPPITVTVQ